MCHHTSSEPARRRTKRGTTPAPPGAHANGKCFSVTSSHTILLESHRAFPKVPRAPRFSIAVVLIGSRARLRAAARAVGSPPHQPCNDGCTPATMMLIDRRPAQTSDAPSRESAQGTGSNRRPFVR